MKLAPKILALVLGSFLLLAGNISQVSGAETLEGEQVAEVKKLSLKAVDVVDMDIFKLSFGVSIDDTKEKDFIVKSLPLGDEIEVTQIAVDNDSVLLSIEKDFESNKQYEVVIISLYGTDGSTIVSGIDGAVEFTAPDMTLFNKKEEVVKVIEENTVEESTGSIVENNGYNNTTDQTTKNKENTEETNTEENNEQPELNAAGEKPKTVAEKIDEANKKNNSVNLAGKEVDKEELDKNIAVAAGKSSDLPTTGPEHVFFVILALILAGLIIHIRRKKV